jgi:uncharacterized membrane protein YphA (DoxX/SURF4 family)
MSTDQRAGWASLLLRSVIGATMIAHGVKHDRTLAGTAGWFESIGFRKPELQARASAAVEIGSGAALLVGAATPLSAAGVVATMIVAARTVHVRNGFFVRRRLGVCGDPGDRRSRANRIRPRALQHRSPTRTPSSAADSSIHDHRSRARASRKRTAPVPLLARTHHHAMSRRDRRWPDPSCALIMRPFAAELCA